MKNCIFCAQNKCWQKTKRPTPGSPTKPSAAVCKSIIELLLASNK